jgi:pimeloyl-ACP methyl ester carboxylesterase
MVAAVGHSMGGMIVLQLAAAHPDCVAAIVMSTRQSFIRQSGALSLRRWRPASRPAITGPAGSESKACSCQTPTGNSWRR